MLENDFLFFITICLKRKHNEVNEFMQRFSFLGQ
jgi:hypothetical protein